MAKKGGREVIKMKSTESDDIIWTYKNKRNTPDRLELKRFDRKKRKHVLFKEAK